MDDDAAFEMYLQKCQNLHEEWHPGAVFDEKVFKEMALKEWKEATEMDKKPFFEAVKAKQQQEWKTFADFARANRDEVWKKNPGISVKEAIKIIQEMWNKKKRYDNLNISEGQIN